MENRLEKLLISDSIGTVSTEICEKSQMKTVMVLAHGAGAGMHHPFMKKLSEDLLQYDIGTVRFNFPYMERGGKRPDYAPVAEKTVMSVLTRTTQIFPHLPVLAAGKSFGGRMTSQLLCKHTFPNVKGVVFYGFPLHPMGNPGTERASHLAGIKIPMLFLQGTRDSLASPSLIKSVCENLPLATLIMIENADHSFKVTKKDPIVDLAKKTHDWLELCKIL
jgi:uncharacterized protein